MAKPIVKKGGKFVPKADAPAAAVELDDLDRSELKALIAEEEIEVRVTKGMEDEEIRDAIRAALEERDGGAPGSGEDDEEEDEEKDDAEETAEDDLSDLDRSALKALIKEEGLDVTVMKKMEDDDIREAIRAARPAPDAEDDEEEDAEEDDEQSDGLDEMERSDLKAYIRENSLDVRVTKGMEDDDIRVAIRAALEAAGGADTEEDDEEDEENEPKPKVTNKRGGSGTAVANWLFTGKELKQELETHKESRRPFVPTFFVPDGESRVVRFRDNEPVAGLYMYSVFNGKRWDKVTKPAEGEVDLFENAGRVPMLVTVYELLDRSEWKDKQGKKHANVPRFWLTSEALHKQIAHISMKRGKLTDTDMEIHREGCKRPAYIITEEKSKTPLSPKELKQPRLSDKLAEFFAPPSEAEQRRLLRLTEGEDSSATDK